MSKDYKVKPKKLYKIEGHDPVIRSEAALLLGCSEPTINTWAKRGVTKCGRSITVVHLLREDK